MSSYTLFQDGDIKINSYQVVTTGLFSSDVGILQSFWTSSAQELATGKYYLDVYQTASSEETAEAQYSVAWGSYQNSGSRTNDLAKPAKSVYSQYAYSILSAGDSKFTVNSVDKDHVFVININRARYKERLNPGTWQYILQSGSYQLSLIDNSTVSTSSLPGSEGGKAYHIVSGSINTSTGTQDIHSSAAPLYFGLSYPDIGIMILDADKVNQYFSSSLYGTWAAATSSIMLTKFVSSSIYFRARSEETVKNSIYFVRAKNSEYNFSTNPTFYDTDGTIIDSMINEPKTYITTVGLYDEMNNLVAVAKLSQPLLKSFDTEQLLKIRLDF